MVAFADSSVMTESEISKKIQLEDALNEGKRALALNDHQSAADLLSSAAQLSVEIFGELEKEVFEPHFYYGKVLLELERAQKCNLITEAIGTDVGTNEDSDLDDEGLDKGIAEETETSVMEENKEITTEIATQEEQNVENFPGGSEQSKQELAKTSEERNCPKDNGKKDDVSGLGECSTAVANKYSVTEMGDSKDDEGEPVTEESCSANDTVEDDDEAGPLQLAWEVLEVARAVCDRNLSEEGWKEKKVEVLLVLAQCSLEGENYTQAVEDLDACIDMAKSIFEPFDRRLAEANYQAGQACCLGGQFWAAAEYFMKAKDVLEAKCSELKKKLESENEGQDPVRKELEELIALIPEIQLKIEDCKGSAEAEKLKEAAMEKLAQVFTGKKLPVGGGVSEERNVDDITLLVRKKGQKRNVEVEGSETTKKSKTIDEVES